MDRLKKTFTENGYPGSTLNRRLCRTATRAEKTEGKKTLVIPYFPGLSDKIGKAARKFNLNVRYSKVKNLGSMLYMYNTKLGHLPDLQKGGDIYKQICGDCSKLYIGETSRKALIRRKEHEKDVRELNMRSAIAEHCHELNHRVDFDKFTIIGEERNWTRRRLKEAIQISKHDTFNRDGGLQIDKRWNRFLL